MKYLANILICFLFLISCNNLAEKNVEIEKEKQVQDSIFTAISKNWDFTFPQTNPEIERELSDWKHWQQFKNELEQKPKTSMLAFRNKIENVSKRADSLPLNVPERFNNPQVRSRLITLNTQLNSLETYMQLPEIPTKKVLPLLKVINKEIEGVYSQMEEVIIKEKIPMEIGEEAMIRALDTTRLANEKLFEENLQKTDSLEKKSLQENKKPSFKPKEN